jgi:uncharacterized protein YkwD
MYSAWKQNFLIFTVATAVFLAGPPVMAEADSCSSDKVQTVVELVNDARKARGLDPVECNQKLLQVARQHSRDMCSEEYISHIDSEGRGINERYRDIGIRYQAGGENIARGTSDPEKVHEGWMANPQHRKNILKSNFDRIGVGVVSCKNGTYWTQAFAGADVRVAQRSKSKPEELTTRKVPRPPRYVPEEPGVWERLYGESVGGTIGTVAGLAVGSSAAWLYAEQNPGIDSDGWMAFSASAGMLASIPAGVYLGGRTVGASGRFWPALAGAVTGASGGLIFLSNPGDNRLTAEEYLGIPALTLTSSVIGYEFAYWLGSDRPRQGYASRPMPTIGYNPRAETPTFGIRFGF